MPLLIYKPGTSSERRFTLKVGLNSVGRNRDNAVWLNRADVSRYHAEIAVTPERVILKDLGSSNHCFVNGRKVKITELADGDEVRFSSIRLRFQIQDDAGSSVTTESAVDDGATVASGSAEAERAPVAGLPMSQAESQGQAASLSAGGAAPASLLRVPEHWTGEIRLFQLKILLETANRLAEPSGTAVRMGHALDLVMQYLDVDRAAVLEQGPLDITPALPEPPDAVPGSAPAAPAASAPHALPVLRTLAVRSRVDEAGGDGDAFYAPVLVAASIARGRPEVAVTDEAIGSDFGVHAACAAPLGPAAADAALYVDSLHASARYTDADVEFIAELAGQLGIALANARALDEIRADDGDLAGFESPDAEPSLVESLPGWLDSAASGP